MITHFDIASQLQNDAHKILNDLNIIDTLSKHGEILYTGSYALNLMVWPDIDLQIKLDDETDKVRVFSELTYQFLLNDAIENIKLINFIPGKKPKMKTGMYMGLTCKVNSTKWKIDIWALNQQDQEESTQYTTTILNKLNDTNKDQILKWKHRLLHNGRVPHLGSYMLYKAILLENLTTDDEIIHYLTHNGVKIG